MRSGRTSGERIDGIIVIDKPPRITSARAVATVKHLTHGGAKVGHAGTLDPFATGVLIVLLGNATHQCEQIMSWPKTYEATVKLGATTATDDMDSPEEPRNSPPVERARVEQALADFVGDIRQRPPVYSAIKIAGQRSCDRARAGRVVELQPRIVHIESITPIDYVWPLLRLRVDCGRGTYIRSLARDLGEKLGTGGYLTELRRTRIGPFGIDSAVRLDQLTEQNVFQHIHSLTA
jgi:tRNA pseudouridine55 synthase